MRRGDNRAVTLLEANDEWQTHDRYMQTELMAANTKPEIVHISTADA